MAKYKCIKKCQWPATGRVYEKDEIVNLNVKNIPKHFEKIDAKKTKPVEPVNPDIVAVGRVLPETEASDDDTTNTQ